MDAGDVAIATVSWVRSQTDASTLYQSLSALAGLGFPVAVGDRGTSEPFLQQLLALPGLRLTVAQEPGLVAQVQSSVRLAADTGRPFILYVEPDKRRFFEEGLTRFIRRAPSDPEVGIILAARSANSFATFPPMQRYTESVINQLCEQLMGVRGDYSYGPFLMSHTLAASVAALPANLGWGWRHAVFLAAQVNGLRIVHLEDDYSCPPDQSSEDDADRKHRLRQLSQNILGLSG
jgi:hypothetical protein